MNIERLKNEMIYTKLQEKRETKNMPRLFTFSTVITAIVVISWVLFVLR